MYKDTIQTFYSKGTMKSCLDKYCKDLPKEDKERFKSYYDMINLIACYSPEIEANMESSNDGDRFYWRNRLGYFMDNIDTNTLAYCFEFFIALTRSREEDNADKEYNFKDFNKFLEKEVHDVYPFL